jgi:DNA-binding IclR family transcriptional regulator
MTDDFAAIRVAKALRLPFTTTPRMLVEFQRQNLLSLDLARAKLFELKTHAWINPAVVARMVSILEGGR